MIHFPLPKSLSHGPRSNTARQSSQIPNQILSQWILDSPPYWSISQIKSSKAPTCSPLGLVAVIIAL